ncbi:MAG: radical SAM protein [Candidatus Omnitrophica bacterium]|nr:radical SAM protein [Candidatus Omnitrophota bacterium]
MKILLAAPSQSKIYGKLSAPDFPPLGLGYIGSVLEAAGRTVNIIDMDADKISEKDFIKKLEEHNYDLVGITTTTPTFNEAISLSKLVKKYSKALTVLGGIHVTALPEESMKFDSVDFIVKGEGERTIVELADYLEGRRGPESIDGIYYRKNGKVHKNKDRELIDNLDEVPFPARHLCNNRNYTYPDTLATPVFPIITSRGCPARCTYCAGSCIFKRKFRTRSPKNIVDEIEYLVREFGAKEIHIWDDNFALIKSRVIRIKDEIKKRNLRLNFAVPDGMRIDSVDEELLSALKEMGIYSIAFGIESGSQKILDRIKKGIKLERIEEVFKITRKYGIEIWAFFIMGLPGETADDIRKTIEFAKKINPDIAKFHILKPFPGTEVYDELLGNNLIFEHNFDNYGIHTSPVHRLKDLTAEEIRDLQKRAYREFYLRPGIFLKQARRLKSIHRLKLNFDAGKNLLKAMIK